MSVCFIYFEIDIFNLRAVYKSFPRRVGRIAIRARFGFTVCIQIQNTINAVGFSAHRVLNNDTSARLRGIGCVCRAQEQKRD